MRERLYEHNKKNYKVFVECVMYLIVYYEQSNQSGSHLKSKVA